MIDWFIVKMKREFGVEVRHEDVGYEAYEFYHDEVDELLIPVEHVEKLPNPMLFEALMYVDPKGHEWIAGLVVSEETRERLYEVWIKDGKRIGWAMYV
ncbi:hypothetical protein [Anoxybacillus gonensis]|uniref:hypothetical protein n=1 Tax=Anoxybacillus gonensis TaxID=198467 RepID=UPI0002BD5EB8|nr:hypothetical protein [Anoxybacillus gonensis]EMI10426.1 hypothetical protein F510_1449 [Anoxybacillus gonensis]